jgi:DNA integrity scanning protein DisA with diadenylate cyclase activity
MSIQKEAFIMILEKVYHRQYEILKVKVKRRTMKLLELMSKCGYDQYQDVINEMFDDSRGYRQTIKIPPLNIVKVNEILRNGSAKLSNLEVRLRRF